MLGLLSVVVGMAGLLLLIRGARGSGVFVTPRCVSCSCDLRLVNFVSGDALTCPGCGANLSSPGAVRFARPRHRIGMLIAGSLLVLIAIGGVASQTFLRPKARVVVRPTPVFPTPMVRVYPAPPPQPAPPPPPTASQLISKLELDPSDLATWTALNRLMTDGSVSSEQVDKVIAIFLPIGPRTDNRSRESPRFQFGQFISSAVAQKRISDTSLKGLYQASYGVPTVMMRKRQRETGPVRFTAQSQKSWWGQGWWVIYSVREVRADDGSIVFPSKLSKWSIREQLLWTSYIHGFGLDRVGSELFGNFSPGEHEFEVIFDFGVVPKETHFRQIYERPGPASEWPNPRFTWQCSARQKTVIVGKNDPIVDAVTDPARDPFRDFRFDIEEALVRPAGNGHEIVVAWKPSSEPSMKLAYDVWLVAGENRFNLGPLADFDGRWPMRQEWKQFVPAIPADLRQVEIVLTPDAKVAEADPLCEEYWGVEHRISAIPLSRYDLSQ